MDLNDADGPRQRRARGTTQKQEKTKKMRSFVCGVMFRQGGTVPFIYQEPCYSRRGYNTVCISEVPFFISGVILRQRGYCVPCYLGSHVTAEGLQYLFYPRSNATAGGYSTFLYLSGHATAEGGTVPFYDSSIAAAGGTCFGMGLQYLVYQKSCYGREYSSTFPNLRSHATADGGTVPFSSQESSERSTVPLHIQVVPLMGSSVHSPNTPGFDRDDTRHPMKQGTIFMRR